MTFSNAWKTCNLNSLRMESYNDINISLITRMIQRDTTLEILTPYNLNNTSPLPSLEKNNNNI